MSEEEEKRSSVVLVVGLGNPGKKYERTRHNVGFHVVERLASAHAFPPFKEKWSGAYAKGELRLGGRAHPVSLLEPQTFMNASGDCVQPAAAFLRVPSSAIVVVHDELDVPFGEVRLKVGGGHAGHNGLRSLIQRLGNPDFVRVRVGIGRPPAGFTGDVAAFVLSDFDPAEKSNLPDLVARAADAVEAVVAEGVDVAMNRLHAKR